jgi:hypothetical protein
MSAAALDERDVIVGADDGGYFRVPAVGYFFNDIERADFVLDERSGISRLALPVITGRSYR